MNVESAYNQWSVQYDTNENKTRDLEAVALRKTLEPLSFSNCLEIGCGTGKNTQWLVTRAQQIVAVDLSEAMLSIAKSKIQNNKVAFVQADILKDWHFTQGMQFDLATFSLVLEHIEHLEPIFQKLSQVVRPGGHVYIGELHPFKQYSGSKARFETEEGLQIVTCFTHHISDFTNAAEEHGFQVVLIDEFFDNDDRSNIPRILTLLLQKKYNS